MPFRKSSELFWCLGKTSEPVMTAAKYGYEPFNEMRYFDSHFVSFAHERKLVTNSTS